MILRKLCPRCCGGGKTTRCDYKVERVGPRRMRRFPVFTDMPCSTCDGRGWL